MESLCQWGFYHAPILANIQEGLQEAPVAIVAKHSNGRRFLDAPLHRADRDRHVMAGVGDAAEQPVGGKAMRSPGA